MSEVAQGSVPCATMDGSYTNPICGTGMILSANSVLGHVIPAKAGIQRLADISYVYIEDLYDGLIGKLDSSLRWNDMLFHTNMGKDQFYKGDYMNSPAVSGMSRLSGQ